MKSQQQTIEQLSRKLAQIANLRLRPSRAGEKFHSPAGQLRSKLPDDFFEWFKCPVHNVWLQPVTKPFKHWRCEVHHRAVQVLGQDMEYVRPAKLRTSIERRIFAVAKFLEELDETDSYNT